MLLLVGDGTDSPNVVATTDHHQVSSLELHMVQDLASLQVESDAVMSLDVRIWVSQGPSIMGHCIGHSFGAASHALDPAKLVASLFLGDLV
eukprot:Skav205397  [mRNA]  locus=scaffold1642:239248:239520:- [translate_table: standard]